MLASNCGHKAALTLGLAQFVYATDFILDLAIRTKRVQNSVRGILWPAIARSVLDAPAVSHTVLPDFSVEGLPSTMLHKTPFEQAPL